MLLKDNFGLAELLTYLAYVMLGMGVFTSLLNVALAKRNSADWRWYLVGAGEIAVGLIILFNDEWAEKSFIQVISVWSLLMGIYLLYTGIKKSTRSVVILLSGVVSIVFALLILFESVTDSQLHLIVGLYAVLLGFYFVNAGFRIRSHRPTPAVPTPEETTTEEL